MKMTIRKEDDEDEGKKCLECGASLGYGRKNRKFCDEQCKNRYHNRRAHDSRAIHLKIISTLNRNYEILEKISRMEMESIFIEDAAKMGFNTAIFTSHRKIRGHNEYSCFEFRYILTPTRICRIMK